VVGVGVAGAWSAPGAHLPRLDHGQVHETRLGLLVLWVVPLLRQQERFFVARDGTHPFDPSPRCQKLLEHRPSRPPPQPSWRSINEQDRRRWR